MLKACLAGVLVLTAVLTVAWSSGSELGEKDVIGSPDIESIGKGLYDKELIAEILSSDGNLYFLLSAQTCYQCDENTSLFIIPEKGFKSLENNNLNRYSFPGEYYDYMTNELVFQASVYYGVCSAASEGGVVMWEQSLLNEEGCWETSTFALTVGNEGVEELRQAGSVRKGDGCYEIPGREFTTEP